MANAAKNLRCKVILRTFRTFRVSDSERDGGWMGNLGNRYRQPQRAP
jgi:hypothetical protein